MNYAVCLWHNIKTSRGQGVYYISVIVSLLEATCFSHLDYSESDAEMNNKIVKRNENYLERKTNDVIFQEPQMYIGFSPEDQTQIYYVMLKLR